MQNFKPHDLLFPLLIFTIFYANQACNQMDHNSLLSLPFKTASPPLNWSSIDCCQWEGVSCDRKGQVKQIWLPSKGLQGSISPFLANLTHLSHLNLSHNSLSSFLPTRLFSALNQLKTVDFSNNYLEGDISSLFSTNGSSLYINSPFIRFLDFSFNHYNDQIPYGLGACSKLEVFRAGFNSLSGPLPLDIYNATRLHEISLPSNHLTGFISDNIVNLTRLVKLELYRNNIGNKLPRNIGKLFQLEYLLLQENSFIGGLPPSLMNLTNLIELNLAFNFFVGEMSILNFSGLSQLAVLDLATNEFTGNLPASLYSCKFLRAIRLSNNRLEGEIGADVVQLKFLSFLSVGYSKLTNITRAIKILMHCKNLNILFLSHNFLQEEIPTDDSIVSSSGFAKLRLLCLADCQLTGQLPVWLSKLKNLEVLYLDANRITGSIPGWLSTLPKLFILDLDENLLSGEFPKELCALPALVSPQPLDNTSFDLPIYVTESFREYHSLSKLRRAISLANNSLSGNIPIEIGHLKQLQELGLGYNNLSGRIPEQISDLTNLEILDLSANQLTGEIPASLANLHFLNVFSVANNKLHGQIPSGTQLQSFDAFDYEGNPGLCGPPLPYQCHISPSKGDKDIHDKENGHTVPWLHISVVLGFITGFWGVCGPLVVNSHWRFVYFKFMGDLKDRIIVKLVVSFSRLNRRFTES